MTTKQLVLALALGPLTAAVPATGQPTAVSQTTPPQIQWAGSQVSTPELVGVTDVTMDNGWGLVAAAPLDGAGLNVGIAFRCDNTTRSPTATIFLGSFPADRRAVQLAVRLEDGRIERFGPLIEQHSGPASGFHSPELTDRGEVMRFTNAAVRSGSLISNGYNSFWVRLTAGTAATVRRRIAECRP